MKEKIKVSVLVSGGGTNLQALIDSVRDGSLPDVEIVSVISSREDAFAIERAGAAGLKTLVLSKNNYPAESGYAEELLKALGAVGTDLVVLAGYMLILHPDVIKKYSGKIINIHPSLIPKHCGKGYYGMRVHKAVIESGDKVSGATAHFVDEGVDTGEIILQREVPILAGDDEYALAARVLKTEHIILPEAIRMVVGKMKEE